MYNVSLEVRGQRERIGVINFFSIAPSGASEHAAGSPGHARTPGTFRFEVTDVVRRLNIIQDSQPKPVFEPTTGLVGPSSTGSRRRRATDGHAVRPVPVPAEA